MIEADGTVSIDSEADVEEMENHNDRPEVMEAKKKWRINDDS